jgi:hypothetical protein
MNPGELALYFWMFPVTLHIFLPLLVLVAWGVIVWPLSLLMRAVGVYFRKPDPQLAR